MGGKLTAGPSLSREMLSHTRIRQRANVDIWSGRKARSARLDRLSDSPLAAREADRPRVAESESHDHVGRSRADHVSCVGSFNDHIQRCESRKGPLCYVGSAFGEVTEVTEYRRRMIRAWSRGADS